MLSVRRISAAIVATATIGFGVAGPATAQNNSQQNGLVNVSVGDVDILNNANIGIAAQVAANICGVNVGPVAVLAANVDASGTQSPVCGTGDQAVRITQA
jgi:hypothetical protein